MRRRRASSRVFSNISSISIMKTKHGVLQFLRLHKHNLSDSKVQRARTRTCRAFRPTTLNSKPQCPTTRACSATIGHRRLMVSDCHSTLTWLEAVVGIKGCDCVTMFFQSGRSSLTLRFWQHGRQAPGLFPVPYAALHTPHVLHRK